MSPPQHGEVWAIVPARSFDTAKSRLEGELAPATRRRVARDLLRGVVSAVRAHAAVAGVILATDDAAVADACDAERVRIDKPDEPLAAIITGAVDDVRRAGARYALVVMADLPLIAPGDVDAMLDRAAEGRVVLAPDHTGRCTNAMCVPLAVPIAMAFGTGESYVRHRDAARAVDHVTVSLLRRGLLRDLDVDGDLSGPVRAWVEARVP